LDKFIFRENARKFCYVITEIVLYILVWKVFLFTVAPFFLNTSLAMLILTFILFLFVIPIVTILIAKKTVDHIFNKLF
jgi:hypothetical protein